jgi:DNA-directed RNA polymerase subunit omega
MPDGTHSKLFQNFSFWDNLIHQYFTRFPGNGILSIMIFPLEELIEYDKNMYEITSAASRRSYQLSMIKDPEVEENDGKMVSLAARQVFTKEIEFRLDIE